MLKKFLICLNMFILFLCVTSTASAKPITLKEINAFELEQETVRIEISSDGKNFSIDDLTSYVTDNYLTLELDNTLIGKLNRLSVAKIQPEVEDLIGKIFVNQTSVEQTKIRIFFNSNVGEYNIFLEPVNRSEKKDPRIIIDIKRGASQENLYDYGGGDGQIIVIDAGHGGSDSGAIGPNGVMEKTITLEVALKTQEILKQSGYQVVMTRTTDIDVAGPRISAAIELQARVDKSPPDAALFISIHCNAFSNETAHGMETYHAPNAIQGERLAILLNEELENLGGLYNRGVKSARFYVMTHSQCPASLIELGFITNPEEEQLLSSSDYQQKLAQAIVNAVNRYFN